MVTGGLEVTPRYGYSSGFAHSVHLHGAARSEVFIINPHLDRPVSGRIGFIDETGHDGTMQLTGLEESEGEWKNFRLEPGASLFASTSESSSFRGSAHVESEERLGTGLLLNTEHGTTGTTSVPASYSFVAPVEVLGSGTRSNTGIAIANLDHRPAEVILFLQDRYGKRWGQEVIQVEGRGQTARFVGEWITVPEDFTGTLMVTANRLIAGTAIRTQPGVFTTYPVLQPRASTRTTFAHFARSGGFTSRLLLLNPSSHLAADNVTIRFRSKAGAPTPVTLNSIRHPSGQLSVSIPPLGIQTLRATDTDLAGWVEVESQVPVGGVVLFGSPEVGTAGVGESHPSRRQVLGIDRDVPARMDTGIALANTTGETVTLLLTVRDQAGQVIGEPAEIVLRPFEQIAHFPDDERLGLQIPSTFRGALWIEASGECAVTAIRQSPGVLTTFPALVLK